MSNNYVLCSHYIDITILSVEENDTTIYLRKDYIAQLNVMSNRRKLTQSLIYKLIYHYNLIIKLLSKTEMLIEKSEFKKWRITIALEAGTRRPLKCKYCQRSYKYKLSLKLHIKEAHSNQLISQKGKHSTTVTNYCDSSSFSTLANPHDLMEPQRVRSNKVFAVKKPTSQSSCHAPLGVKAARKFSVIIPNPNANQ